MYDKLGKSGVGRGTGIPRPGRAAAPEMNDPFGSFPFVFRDPQDLFKEFFGSSAFTSIFKDRESRSNRTQSPVFDPFAAFDMREDFMNISGSGANAFHRAFSSGTSSNTPTISSRRTTTQTVMTNGKVTTTKKYVQYVVLSFYLQL